MTSKADLARSVVDLIPTGKNPLVGAATDAGLGIFLVMILGEENLIYCTRRNAPAI